MTTLAAELSALTRLGRFLGDRPLLPLILLLLALIGLLEAMNSGGIDLSAGTAATICACVMATLSPLVGVPAAIVIGLACALTLGLVNGFGIAICRVHPLIMTLGTALIGTGCLLVYQRHVIATGSSGRSPRKRPSGSGPRVRRPMSSCLAPP